MQLIDTPLWRSQALLSRGREENRSYFVPYADMASAAAFSEELSTRKRSLNGLWQFQWFASPLEVDDALLSGERKAEDNILVPLNWQLAGFGALHYTDEPYPFPMDPPYVPFRNETGVYQKDIELSADDWAFLADGAQLFINFSGVESAFYVYLNGQEIGFNQGSRMHSEFNLTPALKPGSNRLVVQVLQYSAASYLEDQDQWWLGGIIREVSLLLRPALRLRNVKIETDWQEDGLALLSLTLQTTAPCKLRVRLVDAPRPFEDAFFCDAAPGSPDLAAAAQGGAEVQRRYEFTGLLPWSAETPQLYTLLICLENEDGEMLECIPQRVGFRRLEIVAGELRWNGRRLMMRGVNRHEFDAEKGRAVDAVRTRSELELIKRAGMNAVRTSHYPNSPFFYELCDELGLYVIDEADLETHGFEIQGEPQRLCDDPDWREAYLERVRRMVEQDRNHVCVALWSLGNESAYGANFAAMYEWCKANEPIRPVHYEGDRYSQSVDVSGSMYSPPGILAELDAAAAPLRPHILCEFAHAMGNGPGGLKEYIELIENSRRIQGYFVWEFKDHGISRPLRPEAPRSASCPPAPGQYLYGGDFGEAYHNGNFCMDGLIRSDGTPGPGLYEYAKLIEPVRLSDFDAESGRLCVANRYTFQSTAGFGIRGQAFTGVECLVELSLPLPEMPAESSAAITWPAAFLYACAQAETLRFSVGRYGEDGSLLIDEAFPLGRLGVRLRASVPPLQAAVAAPPKWSRTKDALLVQCASLNFRLRLADGRIEDLCRGDELLLHLGPAPNFFRAYTDNDVKLKSLWERYNLHSCEFVPHKLDFSEDETALCVEFSGRFGPQAMLWGCDLTLSYRIYGDDRIELRCRGFFSSDACSQLPKIGLQAEAHERLAEGLYDGLGPDENYSDRCSAALPGVWPIRCDEQAGGYEKPQEYGNRHRVHWLQLHDAGQRLCFWADRPLDVALRPYSDAQLARVAHRWALQKDGRCYVQLDYQNSGLGSASCGPERFDDYQVRPLPFDYTLSFGLGRA